MKVKGGEIEKKMDRAMWRSSERESERKRERTKLSSLTGYRGMYVLPVNFLQTGTDQYCPAILPLCTKYHGIAYFDISNSQLIIIP